MSLIRVYNFNVYNGFIYNLNIIYTELNIFNTKIQGIQSLVTNNVRSLLLKQ